MGWNGPGIGGLNFFDSPGEGEPINGERGNTKIGGARDEEK